MNLEVLKEAAANLFKQPDPFVKAREKSWQMFQDFALLKKKPEAFQYIPLQNLSFPPFEETKVDFIKPEGRIKVLSLEEALSSYAIFLQNRDRHFFKEEKDPFAHLNRTFQKEGLFIYVPPFATHEELFDLSSYLPQEASFLKVHLFVGKGAQLSAIFKSKRKSFCNLVMDIVLDEGAELSFYESLDNAKEALYMSALRASLKTGSSFRYFSQSFGSKISRNSLKVDLLGENAEAVLEGISRLSDVQHHIHAEVIHHAPFAKSRQHFKTVLEDAAQFSFEGKILVQKEAMKTESYQLCNQLLLSDQARAYAKPNLEIFADDVKASHGATFGKLDKEALFYLQSRGLRKASAKKWLVEGFCKELMVRIKDERAISYFSEVSRSRLSR